MTIEPQGPVESFEWGRYVVSGREFGKDIRIVGNRASKWKERKGHRLDAGMITGIGDDVDVLIIGNGVEGALECPADLREALLDRGIREVLVLTTPEACREYNRLHNAGRRVAMLAHGTC